MKQVLPALPIKPHASPICSSHTLHISIADCSDDFAFCYGIISLKSFWPWDCKLLIIFTLAPNPQVLAHKICSTYFSLMCKCMCVCIHAYKFTKINFELSEHTYTGITLNIKKLIFHLKGLLLCVWIAFV